MNKRRIHIISFLLLLWAIIGSSCSTQKNTWLTRHYHQTKVKYNIQFNGQIAFDEGLKAIADANEDDYTTLLNLYPVSNHTAAAASASNMDKSIEKCRKSIKLHSIKTKPKPNPKKRQDPKYKAWLQQEEFNNQLANAWVRLAESEFYKGDFVECVGTFNYVMRHYSYDPDVVARCQLWIARAYAELGWEYEAEEMLQKVEIDNLKRKNAHLYSSVKADVLLKTGHLHEAIPFVKLSIPHEKRKGNRPRFQYVLAQLYERENQNSLAIEAYNKVIRMTPKPEMEFNARIRKAELEGKKSLRSLQKMAKQSKHKDHLDQIYGAIGNIYLNNKDTVSALENYTLAIDNSTQAGYNKAAVLIKAADLYFERKDYALAQPYYREAVTIISTENANYKRLQKRSEILDELIRENDVVVLQDSLQRLSKLSEEKQRQVVDQIIANLIEEEKLAAEQVAQAARNAQNSGVAALDITKMYGGVANSDWYFYNQPLIRQGKQDFQRRWGSRALEDNWRRASKSLSSSFFDDQLDDEQNELENDSTAPIKQTKEKDTHKPEYYLQQIPRTEADIAASDSLIAQALYNLIYIYQDKLEDENMAKQTLADYERRFGYKPQLVDVYYMYYLNALKMDDAVSAEYYRQLITTCFPQSKQAIIVADPDYFERLKRMSQEQDSLYENTYNAYTKGDYTTVKNNKLYAEQQYPLSPLMPRFLFLNAIAQARTNGQDAFIAELKDMVQRYPESELGAMAKDMLAMMGQGMESQTGGTVNNLAELRGQAETQQEDSTEQNVSFSIETRTASCILLAISERDEKILNELLYEVALFNFSQFMIRDFDMHKLEMFANGSALQIVGFESLDETGWYVSLLANNTNIEQVLQRLQVKIVQVTMDNYPLINILGLDAYEEFYSNLP